ncbi:hypothetical protein Taro_027314 [Colocasia esculenta]|uniref:Uncharacterized protein n=1 Tax=Colocasia esculenta TaxID=4460 RepID=A0A843VE75_COLES|nr:hypothetical protein [Colocasia esculenta]
MATEVLSPSGVPEGDASMRRHLGSDTQGVALPGDMGPVAFNNPEGDMGHVAIPWSKVKSTCDLATCDRHGVAIKMATLRPAQPFWTGRDRVLVATRPVFQKGNSNRNRKQAEGDGPHVATRMATEVLSPSGVPEGDASMRRHLGSDTQGVALPDDHPPSLPSTRPQPHHKHIRGEGIM